MKRLINGADRDIAPGADLHGAHLLGADLHGADLHGANLLGADLLGANLLGADLHGANLRDADLRGADLRGADLRDADLYGANLRYADLRDANLLGADLHGANLHGADLHGADLHGADLRGADLRGADLRGANLHGADLRGADLRGAKNVPPLAIATLTVVPEGDVIGWKKCRKDAMVKLRIPAAAARSNATGRKCRAEYAEVLEVLGAEEAFSAHDPSVVYRAGETVHADHWSEDWAVECGGGIHFFITREEAEAY